MRGDVGMRANNARGGIAAIVGLLIILACVGGAALAPWIAPHDPNALVGQRWEAPSPAHWLGLDRLGRDMFSRLLYGGRLSIALALLATVLAFVVGVACGLAAALFGRWFDILLSRIADIVLAVPVMISTLVVIAGFGSGPLTLVLAIGLLYALAVFRAARTAALEIAARDHVEAARLRGEGAGWIARHEILPNAWPSLAAEFGLRFCFAFLTMAALGFLGLGPQAPVSDWGSMVTDNALAIPAGIAAPLYPAAAIGVVALAANMVADWLRSLRARPRIGKA